MTTWCAQIDALAVKFGGDPGAMFFGANVVR